MLDADVVVGDLRAAGEAFGLPAAIVPSLRWGLLLATLDETIDDEYITALELIHEGYLFHYRKSRLSDVAPGRYETALLAGDFLYARGLRLIAERGDVGAVDLLARLMAVCSNLRSVEAPFAADDALWAYTVGGLAALRRGTDLAAVVRLFDELDRALAEGAALDVRSLARAFVGALELHEPTPLVAELAGPVSPSASPDIPMPMAAAV